MTPNILRPVMLMPVEDLSTKIPAKFQAVVNLHPKWSKFPEPPTLIKKKIVL
jgi:hypothetical protein